LTTLRLASHRRESYGITVSTKDPQLVEIGHTPGESGKRLIERLYPMVAEGIAGGLFQPNCR